MSGQGRATQCMLGVKMAGDKGRYKRYIIAEDRGKEQKIPRSSDYFRKSKKGELMLIFIVV